MDNYHQDLSAGRWFKFSLATQLGNVGSEYERALRWKQRRDKDRFEPAFARMLELLDLTISDPRWKNHRLKELTRLREMVCDELDSEAAEFIHPSDLRQYFLYFGILARSERDRLVDLVSAVSK
ncbi:MAG TPA: hypothetical protein VMS31_06060 [Pyrinomonadaceae bacterium]|nr:hypothetical protein [Pyrinomonadaceae bacterium]